MQIVILEYRVACRIEMLLNVSNVIFAGAPAANVMVYAMIFGMVYRVVWLTTCAAVLF